jgi:DNA modification methylase
MSIQLLCGDCLALLPTLGKVDAVITDPPYGIALANHDVDGHRSARSFSIVGDKDTATVKLILDWAEMNNLPTIAFASPAKPWPGKWRDRICWDKGGAVGGGGDVKMCLKRTWELIQVARTRRINGPRRESVWRYTMIGTDSADHVCAKPVDLMIALVETFTAPGETVLDPFMGSGPTGVACKALGRNFIGIDIEPRYVEIARRRIAATTGPLFKESTAGSPAREAVHA